MTVWGTQHNVGSVTAWSTSGPIIETNIDSINSNITKLNLQVITNNEITSRKRSVSILPYPETIIDEDVPPLKRFHNMLDVSSGTSGLLLIEDTNHKNLIDMPLKMEEDGLGTSSNILSRGEKRGRSPSPDEFTPLSKRINCLTLEQSQNQSRETISELMTKRYPPYRPDIISDYYEANRILYNLHMLRLARNNRDHPY